MMIVMTAAVSVIWRHWSVICRPMAPRPADCRDVIGSRCL